MAHHGVWGIATPKNPTLPNAAPKKDWVWLAAVMVGVASVGAVLLILLS